MRRSHLVLAGYLSRYPGRPGLRGTQVAHSRRGRAPRHQRADLFRPAPEARRRPGSQAHPQPAATAENRREGPRHGRRDRRWRAPGPPVGHHPAGAAAGSRSPRSLYRLLLPAGRPRRLRQPDPVHAEPLRRAGAAPDGRDRHGAGNYLRGIIIVASPSASPRSSAFTCSESTTPSRSRCSPASVRSCRTWAWSSAS